MSQSASDGLFTREEVLRGLPDKRASLLLFLIESEVSKRAARLQSAIPVTFVVPEVGMWSTMLLAADLAMDEASVAADHDPIQALKMARQGHRQPSVWELEDHASGWAPGVPSNPQLRAAVAHVMSQRYHLTRGSSAGIRQALGLDTPEVQQVYQRLYSAPIDSIYAPEVSLADQVRNGWTSLVGWVKGIFKSQ